MGFRQQNVVECVEVKGKLGMGVLRGMRREERPTRMELLMWGSRFPGGYLLLALPLNISQLTDQCPKNF